MQTCILCILNILWNVVFGSFSGCVCNAFFHEQKHTQRTKNTYPFGDFTHFKSTQVNSTHMSIWIQQRQSQQQKNHFFWKKRLGKRVLNTRRWSETMKKRKNGCSWLIDWHRRMCVCVSLRSYAIHTHLRLNVNKRWNNSPNLSVYGQSAKSED